MLARFVPTMSDPSSRTDQQFAQKQEYFRKSNERTFGILKKKSRRIKFYNREDIFYVVKCVVAMHDMVVQERIQYNKIENMKTIILTIQSI